MATVELLLEGVGSKKMENHLPAFHSFQKGKNHPGKQRKGGNLGRLFPHLWCMFKQNVSLTVIVCVQTCQHAKSMCLTRSCSGVSTCVCATNVQNVTFLCKGK